MDQDLILEGLFRQVYNEYLSQAISRREPVFGAVVDPFWLWPIEEKIKKEMFQTEFKVCSMHMHNLKSAQLIDVQIKRNPKLNSVATRLLFR